jgi:hypothetical protein
MGGFPGIRHNSSAAAAAQAELRFLTEGLFEI